MPAERTIPGVKQIRKPRIGGVVDILYYHRKTGRRLPDNPDSVEFKTAVERNDAEAAPPEPDGIDTIRSLILKYQAAPDWTDLAASTRNREQFIVDAIDGRFGEMPLAAVEQRGARAIFLEWHSEMAEEHPRAADMKLGKLARILKFGFDREIILRHPLATFRRIYKVDRSEVIWLQEHFRILGAAASEAVNLATFLALHTGQRRGDLLVLRWRQYDGERIRIRQSKTGARVDIKCTRALKVTLDKLRAERQPEETDTILLNEGGKPWAVEGWKSAWQRALLAANMPSVEIDRDDGTKEVFDLHFHDIRGTAVTMLAEAGCTIPEICSITGHSLAGATRILDKYLGATRAMADSAIAKLELRMIG